MSRQIWKFVVEPQITMPVGARVVHFDAQGVEWMIWALVNPDAPTEERSFEICGTGFDVPDDGIYVGTQQVPPMVWHLFEVRVDQ